MKRKAATRAALREMSIGCRRPEDALSYTCLQSDSPVRDAGSFNSEHPTAEGRPWVMNEA